MGSIVILDVVVDFGVVNAVANDVRIPTSNASIRSVLRFMIIVVFLFWVEDVVLCSFTASSLRR